VRSLGAAAAVLDAAREMARRRLVVGTSGNVSARVAGGMLITPSRADYECMTPEDLVLVGAGGHVAAGAREPSLETPLHLAAYAARADVGGVVHTHSVYATAWGMTGEPLVDTEDLAYYGIDSVAVVPRLPAGSVELADACASLLDCRDVLLLEGHGVLTVGADPAGALLLADVIERQAQVSWLTACLRGPGAPLAPAATSASDRAFHR
jgi:L-fuculose-phosphate aldolase